MEQYSKEVVKKLLQRATEKISLEKDAKIKELLTELETIKLEKELNKEFLETAKDNKSETEDLDKILGGLND